jgi:6-pyruvoyltetrahydropterin/6-carboxytetrahydropterin synthase
MFEVWKEFRFDAAHTLEAGPQGDPRYRRMHGHSYQVEVWIRGATSEEGWVMDMGDFEKRIGAVAQQLDHYYLNDIEELGAPTMENISAFVWRALADLKGLSKIVVRRDSSREGCVYRGPPDKHAAGCTAQC